MLEVRILGNQPEPTLVESGMHIVDFEVRTKDEEIFRVGKDMIEQYVALNPELEGCQLYINDPMTVGLYPSHDENGNLYSGNDNPSPFNFDKLVTCIIILPFAKNSRRPETKISLVRIITAAITS